VRAGPAGLRPIAGAADRIELADDAARSSFQKFNASAELLGFLHQFDNRLGLGGTSGYLPTRTGS
jgi:hypothetical protein